MQEPHSAKVYIEELEDIDILPGVASQVDKDLLEEFRNLKGVGFTKKWIGPFMVDQDGKMIFTIGIEDSLIIADDTFREDEINDGFRRIIEDWKDVLRDRRLSAR